MSINMDSTSESADYSDYEYQHLSLNHVERGGNSARSTGIVAVDPLGPQELDINEVAELVSIRIYSQVAGDDFGTASDTAQGNAQYRGVVGANLNGQADLIDAGAGGGRASLDTTGPNDMLETDDGSDAEIRLEGYDKAEVFYHFQAQNDTPFSSDAGGVGGGGGYIGNAETINFRDLTGRGPVLDSNDELSIVSRVVKNQVSSEVEASLRMTLIWDTATVDDAGRRFSIPSDD